MPTVICPQCQVAFDKPADLTEAHCVRCGRVVASQAFQPFVEKPALAATNAAIELPERYASWEEFRSLSPAIQRQMMNLAMQPMPDLRRIRTVPLPPETPSQIDGWSQPLGSLAIPGESRISRTLAIVILFFMGFGSLMVAPCMIFFGDGKRENPAFAVLYLLIGGLCLFFSWQQYWRLPQFGLKLWIFEEGLFMVRGGEMTTARWEEVREYEMSNATGRPLFWLTLDNEAPIVLSVGHCLEVGPLMEYVEIRMASAQLLARLEDICAGKRQRFDAITLDREGIETARFFSPWDEVRRVMADRRAVYIDCERIANWHAIPYRDVSFPNLVLAISQILIEEHKRLPVSV